jgi:surface polysaccharide O-acyltransferase-like enzyme
MRISGNNESGVGIQGDFRLGWADNVRILAIFAVVVLHTAADVMGEADDLGSIRWQICNIYDALVRWSVPAFVMLSGALLLSDSKTESISKFYRKRAARLLIPILFWSTFFLVCTFLKKTATGEEFSLMLVAKKLIAGVPYYHMWFLYMILGLYVITPFLRTLVRNTPRGQILFLVVALFTISTINIAYDWLFSSGGDTPLIINKFLIFLPYYIFGYIVRKSEWEPSKAVLLAVFLLSAFFTAFGCFTVGKSYGLEKGFYFYQYLSITVIPMSISAMFLLKKITAPIINLRFSRHLSELVLGIYIVHPLIILLLKRDALSFNPLISIPLKSVAVFILSAASAQLIQMVPFLRRTI